MYELARDRNACFIIIMITKRDSPVFIHDVIFPTDMLTSFATSYNIYNSCQSTEICILEIPENLSFIYCIMAYVVESTISNEDQFFSEQEAEFKISFQCARHEEHAISVIFLKL